MILFVASMFFVGIIIGYILADYMFKMTNDKLEKLKTWLLSQEYQLEDKEELSHYEQGWNRIIDKTLRKINSLKDEF